MPNGLFGKKKKKEKKPDSYFVFEDPTFSALLQAGLTFLCSSPPSTSAMAGRTNASNLPSEILDKK